MTEKTFAKARTQNPRDIRYPAIADAANLVTNRYWADILGDIARGRCPKKCTIDDECISFLNKRQKEVINYTLKTPEELAEILPPIISSFCGISSIEDFDRDMLAVDGQLQHFVKTTDLNDWRKVNNKSMKRDLIIAYVCRLKAENNYKPATARKLLQTILGAFFTLHTHGADDVTMEDGHITSIDGIEVAEDGTITNTKIDAKLADVETSEAAEPQDKRKTVVDKWVTYLKGMTDRDTTC